MNKQEMETLVATLTPAERMDLFHELRDQSDWRGTVFTIIDVEDMWNQSEEIVALFGEFDSVNWDRVQATWTWRNGLESRLCEIGWDMIGDTLWDMKYEAENP